MDDCKICLTAVASSWDLTVVQNIFLKRQSKKKESNYKLDLKYVQFSHINHRNADTWGEKKLEV